jgi:RNA polymerase sigma factor (sigma-70 family)
MGVVGIGMEDASGVGDLGELYSRHAGHLEQIVRKDVRAPEPLIEDACQFAWSRLVYHRERVRRETALPWLVKTAVYEAFKLTRRAGREVSLDAELAAAGEGGLRERVAAVDEQAERGERLAELRVLPLRQQRVLWLSALGLSYAEIAVHEGATPRTVERQLLRARRKLRALEAA